MGVARICKSIPCSILSDRIIPEFIYENKQIEAVKKFLNNFSLFENKVVEIKEIDRVFEEHFSDSRFKRFFLRALKNFYVFSEPRMHNFKAGLAEEITTFHDLRMRFYEWLNLKYSGFVERSDRKKVIEEFSKEVGVPRELIHRALSYIDAFSYYIEKIRNISEKDFIGLVNYYILTSIISRCSKLSITLVGGVGRYVKKLIYQAKKLRLLEFACIDVQENKFIFDIELSEYSFGESKISPRSSRLSYFISLLVNSHSVKWAIKCRLGGDKNYFFSLRSDSVWLPLLKTPLEIKGSLDEAFDSVLERNLFMTLKETFPQFTVTRESDILMLKNRGIIVPDYTINCGDKKIYVELIGYWREDYIKNKIRKLRDVPEGTNLILILTERNWPLIKTKFPTVKVTKRGSLSEEEFRKLKSILDEICSKTYS